MYVYYDIRWIGCRNKRILTGETKQQYSEKPALGESGVHDEAELERHIVDGQVQIEED